MSGKEPGEMAVITATGLLNTLLIPVIEREFW